MWFYVYNLTINISICHKYREIYNFDSLQKMYMKF